MKKILFVCLGNICRSPALQTVLEACVKKAGREKEFLIDSCGLTANFLGCQADERMRTAAKKRGYLIDHHAKLFDLRYFEIFDLILAVDQEVLSRLQNMAPSLRARAKVRLASDFSKRYKGEEIEDPYLDGKEMFEKVMDMAEEICKQVMGAE